MDGDTDFTGLLAKARQGDADAADRAAAALYTELHDIGFVVVELSKAMVKFRPEIELETRGIGLSGLGSEPGQMHCPFEAIGFLRRIDVESLPPNRVGLSGQRDHQGGEKLTACGHPFGAVDILCVVGTRGMLSNS